MMGNNYFYTIIGLICAFVLLSAVNQHSPAVAQTIPNPVYLPVVIYPPKPTATPIPTSTPAATPTLTLPPPNLDGCKNPLPTPVDAANYPIKIVGVDKTAKPETVQLKNVSNETIDLTGWHMCSVRGTQEHKPIHGTLTPGGTSTFKHDGGFIWRDELRDDGALYNPFWQLVSYWVDPNTD
ncbi:MAG: hypothetical protein R2867_05395 [Caldilineaceae bacterium]